MNIMWEAELNKIRQRVSGLFDKPEDVEEPAFKEESRWIKSI